MRQLKSRSVRSTLLIISGAEEGDERNATLPEFLCDGIDDSGLPSTGRSNDQKYFEIHTGLLLSRKVMFSRGFVIVSAQENVFN